MKAVQIITWLRKLVLGFLGICLAGFTFMWLVFWYMFGSISAFPNFMHTYFVATQAFINPVEKSTLLTGMLKGMISSLAEKHSTYLDQDDFKGMMEQTNASYSGIGVVIGKTDEGVAAVTVMEGQPAETAGIQEGDLILAIDGVDTSTLSLDQVSSRIRGQSGTTVNLTIRHDGQDRDLTVERETISLPTVRGRMLTDDIGYIKISQFAEPTGQDFAKEYKALQEQGMKRLVLDLRNNPGGLLTTATAIADYILPAGPFVTVQARGGPVESYNSSAKAEPIPLVVLVNGSSASASEIIAGAVQDEKAGVVLGTQTYGKGTVQNVLRNFDGQAIKVTIAKYHTPNDRVIDGTGIKPDIEFPLPDGVRPFWKDNDPQIDKAIEVVQTL